MSYRATRERNATDRAFHEALELFRQHEFVAASETLARVTFRHELPKDACRVAQLQAGPSDATNALLAEWYATKIECLLDAGGLLEAPEAPNRDQFDWSARAKTRKCGGGLMERICFVVSSRGNVSSCAKRPQTRTEAGTERHRW
uniref:Uncharacterized protein n=1 Tax=Erythrolobus madagascarensis TaxID=708628 RepID=A0A7S0XII7_9RHOD|mmetsp:Transcript_3814/g.8395  ORF Transcript_3814/g.8395 Transcript_3814/m.8395 type:complete len:145 (+) Transcript_3814:199-633(+)